MKVLTIATTIGTVVMSGGALHAPAASAVVAETPAVASGTALSDRGRIAFSENTSAVGFDIVTVRPDGTGRRRLTNNEDSYTPAYGPAGRRIAFTRCQFDCAVWLMKADGSRKRPLIPSPSSSPAWSPDGKQIVHVSESQCCNGQLFIYTLATGAIRQLTFPGPGLGTRALSPTWSPGGKRIAFIRHDVREGPSGGRVTDAGALFVVRTDGTHLEQITPVGRWIKEDPDWSPGGGRIAYSRVTRGADRIPPETKGIWAIRPDGTDEIRLSRGPEEHPAWAPSGNRLAFARVPSDAHLPGSPGFKEPGLWTRGKLGHRPRLVYPRFFVQSPDWQPRL